MTLSSGGPGARSTSHSWERSFQRDKLWREHPGRKVVDGRVTETPSPPPSPSDASLLEAELEEPFNLDVDFAAEESAHCSKKRSGRPVQDDR